MGKRLILKGNEAAAYGALLCRVEVAAAYPITPQSEIPETLARFSAQGLFKGKFVNPESEMGAIGYVAGAAAAGARVFSATSSQGLAWMHEMLHYAAGARLPIVLVDVNRPLGAPWNLKCGQIDSLSQRDTGWIQLYCESNQEVLDTIIQAYRIAESVSLPCMVCMDGVFLSFTAESVDVPEQAEVDAYLPPHKTVVRPHANRYKLYEREGEVPEPYTEAMTIEFGFMLDRYKLHHLESQCLETVLRADREFREVFGRGYAPVEEYRCEDAEVIAVLSGSAVGTARQVVDTLRERGYRVGLVKQKMFRPFPVGLVRDALRGKKKVAVIERDLSPGQCGIFYQEIKWALNTAWKNEFGVIYGFVAGLGGADITPQLIEKAILFTFEKEEPAEEVIWLGLPVNEGERYGTIIS
ncbi:MAG: pyruvate ferredoxin oxidoreductase [Thermodesulfobacteriota bacterium]|jgi:pyruvate/2-oxoacid:ferredoxin oxidoreductase alpha subunit